MKFLCLGLVATVSANDDIHSPTVGQLVDASIKPLGPYGTAVRIRNVDPLGHTLLVQQQSIHINQLDSTPRRPPVRKLGFRARPFEGWQWEAGKFISVSKKILDIIGALVEDTHVSPQSFVPTVVFRFEHDEYLEFEKSTGARMLGVLPIPKSKEFRDRTGLDLLRNLTTARTQNMSMLSGFGVTEDIKHHDICRDVKHWLLPKHLKGHFGHWHCHRHHPCHEAAERIYLSKRLGFGTVSFQRSTIRDRLGLVVHVIRDLLCHPFFNSFEIDTMAAYKADEYKDHTRGLSAPHYINELADVDIPAYHVRPNDPLVDRQWYLQEIRAFEAQQYTIAHRNPRNPRPLVLVADTGVNPMHPDLRANLWTNQAELNGLEGIDDDGNGVIDDYHGARFSTSNIDGRIMDDDGHGTHCVGNIGAVANNSIGITGINGGSAKIAVCKFLTNGKGHMSDAAKCIDYAVSIGARLISASWAGRSELQILKRAIHRAGFHGIAFSFASGNTGVNYDESSDYLYPACSELPNSLTVVGSCRNHSLLNYGNIGTSCVDLAAPGDRIYSTVSEEQDDPDGDGALSISYKYKGGTSMAAPMPIAVMAMMLELSPRLLPHHLVALVKATATPRALYNGKMRVPGLLDAMAAVKAARATAIVVGDRAEAPRLGGDLRIQPNETVLIPIVGRREPTEMVPGPGGYYPAPDYYPPMDQPPPGYQPGYQPAPDYYPPMDQPLPGYQPTPDYYPPMDQPPPGYQSAPPGYQLDPYYGYRDPYYSASASGYLNILVKRVGADVEASSTVGRSQKISVPFQVRSDNPA